MKNILIAGVAKSGKSTIAKKICAGHEYNHIPMDYFASSLKHNFPECHIKSDVIINKESSKNLSLLLSRVIKLMDYTTEKFIIDSAHLFPKDIASYLDLEKWDVYFVGYPNISLEEKFNNIRKYSTENDWTYNKSDDELISILESLISLSKEIQKQCLELNIKFIDTSYNFEDVINKI